MTHTDRRTRFLPAVAVILPLIGCAGGGEQRPAQEVVLEVGTPTRYLICPQADASARPDTQTIGQGGGRLRSGNNEVSIPASALDGDRQFVLRPVDTDSVGVWIDAGRPVQFAANRSARVTIDVRHCDPDTIAGTDWRVWRIDTITGEGQKLETDINRTRAVTWIDSTSWFMIAN